MARMKLSDNLRLARRELKKIVTADNRARGIKVVRNIRTKKVSRSSASPVSQEQPSGT